MKRQIVLDTELTGLEIDNGDRVIAVGIVEIFNNKTIGREKEWIINPNGRKSHPEALKVHGITDDFLTAQPLFEDVVQEIREFIGDSEIVHHCWYDKETGHSVDENAMNMEFKSAGFKTIPHEKYLNIKKWAQQINPDENSLDHMLDLYKIDRSTRDKHHGALIDAKLTAAYYKKIAPKFCK